MSKLNNANKVKLTSSAKRVLMSLPPNHGQQGAKVGNGVTVETDVLYRVDQELDQHAVVSRCFGRK